MSNDVKPVKIPEILERNGFSLDTHIFRYRPDKDFKMKGDSGTIINHCINEVESRTIWHSAIGALNDPFEVYAQKNLDEFGQMPFHKKIKLFAMYAKQRKMGGILAASPHVLERLYRAHEPELKAAIEEVNRGKTFETFIAEMRSEVAISCFTAVCDSRLMWGYYCNGLSGGSLIYNKKKLLKNNIELNKVSYINGPFKVDLLDFVFNYEETKRIKTLSQIVKTKHIEWAHEHEYRCVTALEGGEIGFGRTVTLGENCIDGIIIGKKVRNDIIKQLRRLAKKNHIKIYMADVDYQNFKVHIYQ